MKKVKVKDKEFVISIDSATIQKRVAELAQQIEEDLNGATPIFLGVLNGSVFFATDLFRRINQDAEITFMRVSSYSGTASTGTVKNIVGIKIGRAHV